MCAKIRERTPHLKNLREEDFIDEQDGEQAGTAGYWRWTGGHHHCLLPPQVFATDFLESQAKTSYRM
jgi:hypothetical protein